MAIENFGVNTLIIPMDTTYQNNGMFKVYGLVYQLLSKGIPVKWAIQPGKPFDGTDFTATAQDINTLTPIINHNYTGGPFIIDSAIDSELYNDALVIISNWQTLYPVAVHLPTAPFTADIASTMTRAPRIAVPTYNRNIMTDYLNLAAIPDSNGDPWPGSSPDILTAPNIENGALFGYDKSECRRIYYDILLSPPEASGTWNNPDRANELKEYLRLGGYLHAVDDSIEEIENEAGPFLTVGGIHIANQYKDKGETGTFTVDIPDFPVDQGVSTVPQQGLPGGNLETWYHQTPGLTYNSETQTLAHFIDDNKQYDFMIAGPYKNGSGAGKIVYEGGRDYNPEEPYSLNMENLYTRFVLNSIFFSVSKPLLYLEKSSPEVIFAGINNTITFAIVNKGGSLAPNTSFSVTLVSGMTYNNDATIPPTSIVGQTLTWSSAALDTVQPGTVLNFTADFVPPAPVVTKLADFSTSFGDEFGESYSLDSCLSSKVEEFKRAYLKVEKFVDKGYAVAGDTLTYTVIITNNGELTAENVVFKDPIPAGAIFNNNVTVQYPPGPVTHLPVADPASGIPLDDIPPGGSAVVTFQVLVGHNDPLIDIVNQAFVDYQFTNLEDTFDATAESNIVITQVEAAELEAVKSVDKSTASVGDALTYTVVINNTGTVDVNNVVFRDNPPNGTSFVPNSVTVQYPPGPIIHIPSADPSAPGGILLGDIPSGSSVIVAFQVTIDVIPVPNPAVNFATIDADFPIDPDNPTHKTFDTNPVETTVRTSPFKGFKQFSLQEKVCLPAAKPDIEEINKVNAEVVIICTKVIKTPKATSAEGQKLTGFKLIVEGELSQIVEYIADEPTQSLHAAHFNMPFSTFIVLPEGYVQGTPVVVTGHIEDIYTKQMDKRCIFKNITLLVTAK